jgi:hypothetical protein
MCQKTCVNWNSVIVSGVLALAVILPAGCGKAVGRASPGEYKNLALNPDDVQGPVKRYPHATSNSECRNEACFAAKNVIDGKTANSGHGPQWPSWGPDKRADLWLRIDFGKTVEVDKAVIYIRADFPHDDYWRSGTIEFSDGSREPITLKKTASGQTFKFAPRQTQWIRITNLVAEEPQGWCGFTEVEVWGRPLR